MSKTRRVRRHDFDRPRFVFQHTGAAEIYAFGSDGKLSSDEHRPALRARQPGNRFYFDQQRARSFAAYRPRKDLRERAYQIFGSQTIESLLKVEGGREYVAKISGFVSAPRERRTTRDGQYFFINGRFVKDKIISGGLLEGFRAVLPHGVYPLAFLFLEIPFEELDVNVHPSKTEVRFRRSRSRQRNHRRSRARRVGERGNCWRFQIRDSKFQIRTIRANK